MADANAEDDANDEELVVLQIKATRQAATDSRDTAMRIFNDEIGKVVSDPKITAACTAIVEKDEITIGKCNQQIVSIILERADVEAWLATLNDYTGQMEAQTAALKDDIVLLNQAKGVAAAIAGLLSYL